MLQKLYYRTYWILILIFCVYSQSISQHTDYSIYPLLSYRIMDTKIQINKNIDDEILYGMVEYKLEMMREGINVLQFNAANMVIEKVIINDIQAPFKLEKGKLMVQYNAYFEVNQQYRIAITYRANSHLNPIKNYQGMMYTSFLPLFLHHWLPVFDHPRMMSPVQLTFDIPDGYDVVSVGQLKKQASIESDKNHVIWHSDISIPITSIFWVMGNMAYQTNLRDGNLMLYYDPSLEKYLTEDILLYIDQIIEEVGKITQKPLPYMPLKIVLLDDVIVDTKKYGAGVILIDVHKNIKLQLLRGIIAQWFGVYLREESWDSADGIHFLQQVIEKKIRDEINDIVLNNDTKKNLIDSINTIYDVFSTASSNQWYNSMQMAKNQSRYETVLKVMPFILDNSRVISWHTIADVIYNKTGLYYETPLNTHTEDIEITSYNVKYIYREATNKLRLTIQKNDGGQQQRVPIKLVEVLSDGNEKIHRWSIQGDNMDVTFSVSPNFMYAWLDYSSSLLSLDENKPIDMLLAQLRHDKSVLNRIQAISSIEKYHSNQEDIELGLIGILKNESNLKVKTVLYRVISHIYDGKVGTEDIFIDALKNRDEAFIKDILLVLSAYKNNIKLNEKLHAMMTQSYSDELKKHIWHTYVKISNPEQWVSLYQELNERDIMSNDLKLTILKDIIQVDKTIDKEEIFSLLSLSYPHAIRYKAVRILIDTQMITYQDDQLLLLLIKDNDPYIRIAIVKLVSSFNSRERNKWLERIEKIEYDARVLKIVYGYKI